MIHSYDYKAIIEQKEQVLIKLQQETKELEEEIIKLKQDQIIKEKGYIEIEIESPLAWDGKKYQYRSPTKIIRYGLIGVFLNGK